MNKFDELEKIIISNITSVSGFGTLYLPEGNGIVKEIIINLFNKFREIHHDINNPTHKEIYLCNAEMRRPTSLEGFVVYTKNKIALNIMTQTALDILNMRRTQAGYSCINNSGKYDYNLYLSFSDCDDSRSDVFNLRDAIYEAYDIFELVYKQVSTNNSYPAFKWDIII